MEIKNELTKSEIRELEIIIATKRRTCKDEEEHKRLSNIYNKLISMEYNIT